MRIRNIFINKVCSSDELLTVTSNPSLIEDHIAATSRRRWNPAPYHTLLKRNTSLEWSSTYILINPTNCRFAALDIYIMLERLKITLNHFVRKIKFSSRTVSVVFDTLRKLQVIPRI